ncbi:MAG: Sec-independent protein translocase protein TatB [Bdellovibrionales bacterium]
MFNLGFSELLLVGAIALIFLGPEQLPQLARSLGRLLNELRRASQDFQSTITDGVRDDFTDRLHESRQQHANAEQASPPPVAADPHASETTEPASTATTSTDTPAPNTDHKHES